jgi:ATP-dependent DNA helicase RecQ
LREIDPPSRKRGGARAGAAGADRSSASPLLKALRDWRLATARQNGLPAYVIFHDATLESIAAAHPQTLEELRAISGIGLTKLERYGAALMEITSHH